MSKRKALFTFFMAWLLSLFLLPMPNGPAYAMDEQSKESLETSNVVQRQQDSPVDYKSRGNSLLKKGQLDEASRLAVVYDADLLGNPEALIAGYAHAMAHYLGQTARRPPPGGTAYWPQATEVLAVFMGFGLMFANSAFSVPVRSCGSCGSPPAQRRSYLTQYESTYALAIFSVLKGLANKAVLGHLKKALRPFFRQCVKEIQGKPEELERLKSLSPRPTPETAGAMAEFS